MLADVDASMAIQAIQFVNTTLTQINVMISTIRIIVQTMENAHEMTDFT